MPNNITQLGMVEITEGDTWEIVSQMPPDMKNLGRKQLVTMCDEVYSTKYLIATCYWQCQRSSAASETHCGRTGYPLRVLNQSRVWLSPTDFYEEGILYHSATHVFH
jgi:hypothetical protein